MTRHDPLCYIYIRVSHPKKFASAEEQAQFDESLRVQASRCRIWYEQRVKPMGVTLYPEVLTEPRTSAREIPLRDRPKGRWLDEHLMRGDHVIFAYFDRSVRQLRDWANLLPDWQGRGITLHFVDAEIDLSTAHGQLIANILASVAQHDSDQKSERLKHIAQSLMAAGRFLGRQPPPGYKIIGKGKTRRLDHDREQFPALQEITRLREVEKMTWRQISESIESRQCAHDGIFFRPSAFFPRYWTNQRCRRAYLAWKRIQAELAGQPMTAYALEPPKPKHRGRRRRITLP